jgi:hypothetical protein
MFILANSGDVLVMSETVGAYPINLTLSSLVFSPTSKNRINNIGLLMDISLVYSHAILTNM